MNLTSLLNHFARPVRKMLMHFVEVNKSAATIVHQLAFSNYVYQNVQTYKLNILFQTRTIEETFKQNVVKLTFLFCCTQKLTRFIRRSCFTAYMIALAFVFCV